jgi:hypothetical protein
VCLTRDQPPRFTPLAFLVAPDDGGDSRGVQAVEVKPSPRSIRTLRGRRPAPPGDDLHGLAAFVVDALPGHWGSPG